MRILITSNTAWSLMNFRVPLIRTFTSAGHTVATAAPVDDASEALKEFCPYYPLRHLIPDGKNPIADLRALGEYRRILRRFKPDCVFSFTPKSNIYVSFAARGLGVRIVPTINGLGRGLTSRSPVGRLVRVLYRFALRRCLLVFVQNLDDKRFLAEHRIIPAHRIAVTAGSGIDLARFSPAERPEGEGTSPGSVQFLYIGRLLEEKGIGLLIESVAELQRQRVEVSLRIAGPIAQNARPPLREEDILDRHRSGAIDYRGEVSDVRPLIASCDAVVLPSWYPEGVPRSLLEALAMGKPVITTDTAGCRDTFNGANGYLVQPGDRDALTQVLARFSRLTPAERRAMGQASRRHAEQHFDQAFVIQQYRDALREYVPPKPSGRGLRPLFLTQYFAPNVSGVALIITQLTRELSATHRMRPVVMTGTRDVTRNGSSRTVSSPVQTIRVPTIAAGKKSFLHRILEYALFYPAVFFHLRRHAQRYDSVVSLSTPPLLTAVAAAGLRGKSTPLVYYAQDLYPELLFDMGYVRNEWLVRRLAAVNRLMLRRVTTTVAIGSCMETKLRRHYGTRVRSMVSVPNWATGGRFQVPNGTGTAQLLYTGNMGLAHDFTLLAPLAASLRDVPGLSWRFVGSGRRERTVRQIMKRSGETRVQFEPFLDAEAFENALSDATLCIVAQSDATVGDVVPSKVYGYLAAGRPVLFFGPEKSEVGQLLHDLDAGVIVELPEDVPAALDFVRRCMEDGSWYVRRCADIAAGYNEQFGVKVSAQRFADVLMAQKDHACTHTELISAGS
ncbi:MAG: glycosyltransferase [Spirochaetaceae bacterium]